MREFICQKGHYRNLRSYQVAERIYDITVVFVRRFLNTTDRTCDQMVQAARSGKQNIAEGSAAGSTSKETEIKLTNVAKASLQELLLDYEDYLRVHRLVIWDKNSDKAVQTRRACRQHDDPEYYLAAAESRSAETLANIAIVMIHQADVLLYRLIERQKADFLQYGGIREQMTRARREVLSSLSSLSSPSSPSSPNNPDKDNTL